MKKLMTSLVAILAVAMTLVVPQVANAAVPGSSHEAVASGQPFTEIAKSLEAVTAVRTIAMSPQTGEYEYICIMPDGNSWSLYVGEPTTDCHGSFMHKYINGSMVANISLAPQPASSINPHAWDCIFALAGSVALIWDPPAETWIWITSAAAAGWGLQACLA